MLVLSTHRNLSPLAILSIKTLACYALYSNYFVNCTKLRLSEALLKPRFNCTKYPLAAGSVRTRWVAQVLHWERCANQLRKEESEGTEERKGGKNGKRGRKNCSPMGVFESRRLLADNDTIQSGINPYRLRIQGRNWRGACLG